MDRDEMEVPAMIIYREIFTGSRRLPDVKLGRLFRGLMQYAFTGEVPELDGTAAALFDIAKPGIDKNAAKYARRCEINREVGKKGGRPRKDGNPPGYGKTQENPMGYLETQTNPENPNYNYNDNYNDNDLRSSGFMDAEEAAAQQQQIDAVLDAAARAGIPQDSTTLDKLVALIGEYTAEWTAKAINDANEQGKTSLAYLRAILERYRKQGDTEDRRIIPMKRRRAAGSPADILEGCPDEL